MEKEKYPETKKLKEIFRQLRAKNPKLPRPDKEAKGTPKIELGPAPDVPIQRERPKGILRDSRGKRVHGI